MTEHTEVEKNLRSAYQAQGFMRLVGAQVAAVAPGRVEMHLAKRPEVLQHLGFFHGGAIAFLIDNATTGAAGTLADREKQLVLTAEYKVNFLAPATGERLEAVAEVVKPGRALSVVEAKVWSVTGAQRRLCAIALASIATVERDKVRMEKLQTEGARTAD